VAGNKAGLKESWACNLSFADAGGGVNTPSDLPSGDVFIACDFGGDPLPVDEIDPDHFFKVTPVIPNPLSDKLGLGGGIRFHGGRKIDLGAQSRKRCKSGAGFYAKSLK
jgi:hypothetical protein